MLGANTMNIDKEFLKQIDEQQKEIDLLEKALEEDEDFLNWIEQE
jgi:hypothetical protein